MNAERASVDLEDEKHRIKLRLLDPHTHTRSVFEQHGCTIEEDVLQAPFPPAAQQAGERAYWLLLPPSTRREERHTDLWYARTYRLMLPDGSIFDEVYHLDFQQSIVSPLPFGLGLMKRQVQEEKL